MHDSGGHMPGGDTSSFTGHTAHTGYDPAGAPMGSYHPGQNPNDAFYYANGGTSPATGGTPWPSNGAKVRRRSPAAAVAIVLLAAVVPILMMLIMLKFIFS